MKLSTRLLSLSRTGESLSWDCHTNTGSESMAFSPRATAYTIPYLAGEVHALLLFGEAIVHVFPKRGELGRELETAEQVGLARLEVTALNDAFLEGFQFAMKRLRETLQAAGESQ
jgi:hypothetical protein